MRSYAAKASTIPKACDTLYLFHDLPLNIYNISIPGCIHCVGSMINDDNIYQDTSGGTPLSAYVHCIFNT